MLPGVRMPSVAPSRPSRNTCQPAADPVRYLSLVPDQLKVSTQPSPSGASSKRTTDGCSASPVQVQAKSRGGSKATTSPSVIAKDGSSAKRSSTRAPNRGSGKKNIGADPAG